MACSHATASLFAHNESAHARGLTMFMLMGLPITVIGYMGTPAGFGGFKSGVYGLGFRVKGFRV